MISKLKSLFNPLERPEDKSLEDFELYYLDSRDFVRASIYWMVRDQNIDDLVQETYLRAWKNFKGFQDRSTFRTWIYRIAMNVTYDFFNKSKKVKSLDNLNEPVAYEINIELEDLITKAVLEMNPKQREAFNLFYKFGYTIEEIADLTDSKLGTVKSRLHHAKEIFSNYIKEDEARNG